jgi:hypothetical protein
MSWWRGSTSAGRRSNSLNASVEIQASVLKSKEGVAKDYTSIRGIILMLKPEMLRVYGRVPVLGTRLSTW